MDMLFVYEDRIARDIEGNYYTGSAFSQEIFDRYLQHFDHITLLMRKAAVDPHDTKALGRLNRIDTSRIDVVMLPDLTANLKSYFSPGLRKKFKKTVIDNILPGRAIIIRVPSGSGTIAADYCHAHKIPYLAEVVGCPRDSLWNHSLRGKVLAPGAWYDLRRVMRHADYAVYVTNQFLQKRYPTKGRAASISDVELLPVNEALLEKRLLKIQNHTGNLKIATAGAVNLSYKGQQFVIEALSLLKAKGRTDFAYHLAGGGDFSALRDFARKLGVADQVIFEGSLPHDAMFAWLDEMDLYIQPSLLEGLPRALVEAMSRALPALGSQTGGIPELLS